MSRKYKFHDKEGLYFVSFAVVYWIDVFTREVYNNIFIETLKFYQKNRLVLNAFCIMPSHVHMIFSDKERRPELLLGNIKRYASQKIQKEIEHNPKESRKEWLLWMFEHAAVKASNVHQRMFWQHHNKPIVLWRKDIVAQKLRYIHQTPVKAGYVHEPEDWIYSSAVNYGGGNGVIDIELLA